MTSSEIEEWASAFIAFQQDPDRNREGHPLFWAAEKFMLPGEWADIEDCWRTILAILAREPSEAVTSILAAGPLEDLIHHAGPQVIDRVELEARRNPSFRHLLGGVWQSSTPDIWGRIVAARGGTW